MKTFLERLNPTAREQIIRAAQIIDAREKKPVTRADLVRQLVRRAGITGRGYFIAEDGIDYKG